MENLQHHWSNNLRKNLNKLHCATGYWLPCSLFKFFLKLLDQWCWRFSEGYLNNFSTELSTQIFDCCPRNFLIQEERIGNVVSTSHWIRPVLWQTSVYVLQFFLRFELNKSCMSALVFRHSWIPICTKKLWFLITRGSLEAGSEEMKVTHWWKKKRLSGPQLGHLRFCLVKIWDRFLLRSAST